MAKAARNEQLKYLASAAAVTEPSNLMVTTFHPALRAPRAAMPPPLQRAAAPLVSSATLRRNASMRLTTRCGGAKVFPALWNGAGLLGLQMRQRGLLVAVPEGRGVKLAGLAVEDMLGRREHVGRRSGRSQK